jgi:hypothetical protein
MMQYISHAVQHWTAPHWFRANSERIDVITWGLAAFDHLNVLSQLPLTRRLICGIQASSLIGASCPVNDVGCPPDSSGHILTTLSQPPEKTVVPSSFHAEHRTYTKYHQTVVVKQCRQGQGNVAVPWKPKLKIRIELIIESSDRKCRSTGWSCEIDALAWHWPPGWTSQHRTCIRNQTAQSHLSISLGDLWKQKRFICRARGSDGGGGGGLTWLSQEVAMRWLALGLKLRLETESPGAGVTCAEGKKVLNRIGPYGRGLVFRPRSAGSGEAHVPRGTCWGWGRLRRRWSSPLEGVGRIWGRKGGREGGGRAGGVRGIGEGFGLFYLWQGKLAWDPRPHQGSRGLDAVGGWMLGRLGPLVFGLLLVQKHNQPSWRGGNFFISYEHFCLDLPTLKKIRIFFENHEHFIINFVYILSKTKNT